MELIVKANSFEELRRALEELTQMKPEEKMPEEKKPEAKPQAEAVPPVVEQTEASAETTPAPVKTSTSIEMVRKSLTNLIDLKGRAAVREILKKYGVARVTELKPEDFDAVIEEAANAAK